MFNTRLSSVLILVFFFFSFQKSFSQCFEIESILSNACGGDEGLNEMVRFKVGANAINLNTNPLSVVWPTGNSWLGLVQNSTTASKITILNAGISAAGGCGDVRQPSGGILPANAKVILITSYNMDPVLNSFGALSETIYLIFQNNANVVSGHFSNSGSTPQTFFMSITGICSDSVTYDRSLLLPGDGSTINFTPSGNPSFVNNGCVAPVPVFTVDAGTTPITACPDSTVTLTGTAQGQQSVAWSAPSGTFSNPISVNSTYTIASGATGPITITLTATNPSSCIANITDTVTLNIGTITAPIIGLITQPTCVSATGSVSLSGLPIGNWTLNPGGITGSSTTTTVSNLATGTINYSVTNAANCTSSASANMVINPQPLNPSAPIIDLITQPTCTTATGSVTLSGLPTGNWTLNPGGITGLSTTTTVSNLATGAINYTITNAANCTSSASANVVINAQPSNPSAPIIGLITQPTCASATGNVALSGLPSGNWTLNPGGITGSTATTTVSNLATGIINYTVTNAANCSSSASANVVIGNQPATANPIFTPISPLCFGTSITLPIISNNGISGSWSPLFNPTISTTYTFTPNGGQCLNPTTLQVQIIPLPKPIINDGVICIDAAGVTSHTYTLNTGLNALDYSFQWSLNGSTIATTTTTFEALEAGFYTVVATNLVNGCSSLPTSATVFESNPATSFTAAVTSLYFSENATISATALGGNGTYQFSLDYGPFQTSPIFDNVAPGEHTISINDTNGCTNLLPITLNTIGYPTYFTPNGDGFHDYWNIIGLENQPTAKVYIFDKYGKLIKQISTKSLGWDGTYNGNPMPSSDYWFTIDYLEPDTKTFKAHFSLKR